MVKLLWVENHAAFARIAGRQFLSAHVLTVVPSLAAARAALAENTFDAVLVDYDLDDGKGSDLIAFVRQLPFAPVVIATSSHTEGNEKLLAAGANAVCSKTRFAEVEIVLTRAISARSRDSGNEKGQQGTAIGDVRRASSLHRNAITMRLESERELRQCLEDRDELVRHVAAIQLASVRPRELPEASTRELLSTLLRVSRVGDDSPLTDEYAAATDTGDDCRDLGQDIALALGQLPPGSADFAILPLLSLWGRDRQFYEAAMAAVALAFPKGKTAPAQLSATQRAVVVALTEDVAIWTSCADFPRMLAERGLDSTPARMRAQLEGGNGS